MRICKVNSQTVGNNVVANILKGQQFVQLKVDKVARSVKCCGPTYRCQTTNFVEFNLNQLRHYNPQKKKKNSSKRYGIRNKYKRV